MPSGRLAPTAPWVILATSAEAGRHSADRMAIVERDELRQWILEHELTRGDAWDSTTLEIRFAELWDIDRGFDGAWTFEGIDPALITYGTIAMILAEFSDDQNHPPSYVLDDHRNILSWGGDATSADMVITVSAALLSAAPAVYQIIRDRLTNTTRRAENAAFDTLDVEEADNYARWYLEAHLTGKRCWEGPADIIDTFVGTAEVHEGDRHVFTYEREGTRHEVTVEHVPGRPRVTSYKRLPSPLD